MKPRGWYEWLVAAAVALNLVAMVESLTRSHYLLAINEALIALLFLSIVMARRTIASQRMAIRVQRQALELRSR